MPPINPDDNRGIGADKERLARDFLQRQGLIWVTSNYRCRMGEIDLIMRDGGILVFIEVRYRASDRFGGAAASVGFAKQRRLLAAAGHYLRASTLNLPCRFDVLAMGAENRIDWIRGAFDAC